MTLEAVAYIAGIVAAVTGAGSLYYAWRQHNGHIPSEPPRSAGNAVPADRPQATAEPAQPREPSPEPYARRVSVPTEVPDNLMLSFETAKGMWNKPNRDQALIAVAKRALDLDRINFAVAVAAEMWNKSSKDDLLTEIVTRALDKGQLQQAKEATDHFFNLPKKDRAMRMIIERAA